MSDTTPDALGDNAEGPRLLLFGVTKLSEMLDKGNVWYVRNYEAYFKRVDIAYLIGRCDDQAQGATRLRSLGKGRGVLDLLFAPWRLAKLAHQVKPDVVLTADQVFSWWTGSLLRLAGYKIVLMPVSVPEGLYGDHGDTLSGLPVWAERRLVRLSFASATRVLTGLAAGGYVDIMRQYRPARNKLLIVKSFGEALPSPAFLAQRHQFRWVAKPQDARPFQMIYVGRLHSEKLVDDLIRCVAEIRRARPSLEIALKIVGDGPQAAALQKLTDSLAVAPYIKFTGALPNDEIANALSHASVFVSPLTGNSLREAALVGLPIIAYERDWIVGMLKDEATALLVPSRDVAGLAQAVIRLADAPDLQETLSRNVLALAEDLWTPEGLHSSLAELHAAVSTKP